MPSSTRTAPPTPTSSSASPRRTAFHLTREGHRALEDADAAVAACLTELGSHLDADEAEAAVRGLEVADKAIRRHREAGVR